MNRLFALILLLAAGGLLRAQDEPRTKPEGKGRAEPPERVVDPTAAEAREIFDAARKAQRKGEAVAAVTSFEGSFDVELIQYDETGKADRKQGRARQVWVERPAAGKDATKKRTAYRREIQTDFSKERVVLACEVDDTCWRRSDVGVKVGRVQLLTRLADAEDRDEIREEKRNVGQLLRLFFLERIAVDDDSFRVLERDRPLDVVIGEAMFEHRTDAIAFEDLQGTAFKLWLDRETRHPVKASIRLPGKKDWNEVRMAQHHEVKVGADTVIVVPFNIAWYDAAGRPVLTAAADDPEDLRFNAIDETRYRELFPPLPE